MVVSPLDEVDVFVKRAKVTQQTNLQKNGPLNLKSNILKTENK